MLHGEEAGSVDPQALALGPARVHHATNGHTTRERSGRPDAIADGRLASATDGGQPNMPSIPPEALDACIVALRRMGGSKLRSVGVISSGRGEGRSTVASAMASIEASEYRRKTILVELDLDMPSAARGLGLAESPGVAEYLRDGEPIESCIQWPSDNLGVVVAGLGEPRGQLLRSSAAAGLAAALRKHANILVYDLPPLERGARGIHLVDLCDTIALVVRAGRATTHEIEEAVAALDAPPFVILNGVKSAAPSWIRRMLGMR